MDQNLEIIAGSLEETMALGRQIGRLACGGQCIALEGILGTGKTQLVRGISLGANVANVSLVNSPTYVLLNVYEAASNDSGNIGVTDGKTVYHLDAYRVKNSDDFSAVGLPELLEQDGLVVIEWASRVTDLLPEDHLLIQGELIDECTRRWQLKAFGPQSKKLVEAIRSE